MRAARLMALVGATIVVGGCTGSTEQAAPGTTLPERVRIEVALASAIAPFDSCAALAEVARAEAAPHVSAYGLRGGLGFMALEDGMFRAEALAAGGDQLDAAASQTSVGGAVAKSGGGPEFSETNNQEAGVDEPDLVKTDGRRLVTLAEDRLRVLDVTAEDPRLLGELRLDRTQRPSSLFLFADRVLVFGSGVRPDRRAEMGDEGGAITPSGPAIRSWMGPDQSFIASVDISDPKDPEIVSTVWHDGRFVTARLIDGVARAVFHTGAPSRIDFIRPEPLPYLRSGDPSELKLHEQMSKERADAALAENRRILEAAEGEAWLPEVAVESPSGTVEPAPVAGCDDVFAPEDVSGTGMVSVLSIDARTGKAGGEAVVMGAAEQVYASTSSIYAVTADWETLQKQTPEGQPIERDLRSAIHQFDISDPAGATYVASGSVPGSMLNQFSMSEHEGVLRVATTSGGWQGNGPDSESFVTTLRRDGKALVQVGQVGGLGKGERIYSARFIGATGYVVTFRQTDPLYVVDLRDPTAPKVTGELKIPGYSAYLHPMGDGWLIGLGQDANEDGRVQGTQLSVFDVRDPANPMRRHVHAMKGGSSSAEYDHHAFLHWAKTGMTVIPMADYGTSGDPRRWFLGAVGFRIDAQDGINEVARIEHPDTGNRRSYEGQVLGQIQRSLVVGDRLLTVSPAGVLASDLGSLETEGWLAF